MDRTEARFKEVIVEKTVARGEQLLRLQGDDGVPCGPAVGDDNYAIPHASDAPR